MLDIKPKNQDTINDIKDLNLNIKYSLFSMEIDQAILDLNLNQMKWPKGTNQLLRCLSNVLCIGNAKKNTQHKANEVEKILLWKLYWQHREAGALS